MFCNALGEPVRATYATHPTSWARPFHYTKALGCQIQQFKKKFMFNKYFGPSLELITRSFIYYRRVIGEGTLSLACFQLVSPLKARKFY
jgi:hypothetical protein